MTYALSGYLAALLILLAAWGWASYNIWRDFYCGCLGSYGKSWMRLAIFAVSLWGIYYLCVVGPA